MFSFINNLIPSKQQEMKEQKEAQEANQAVQEAKTDVDSVEQMEFELTLGINQTSGKLNELEQKRDLVFKNVSIAENQLKLLSTTQLTEQQKQETQRLIDQLENETKPAIATMDKEIDILTKKLLDLYNKRDYLTQRKVEAENNMDSAGKTFPIESNTQPMTEREESETIDTPLFPNEKNV
ncbi:hypothetical protein CYY_000863 [Polysphondylium violaceum]|uniref:Uncharacterized protein n=1 Tax=Polysphondylium violaceum TaxID=133409 RepID=A0A8J4V565_9MYCE|nr:hypothetical protein CYY_000863 [Polysphondylium violaceum]